MYSKTSYVHTPPSPSCSFAYLRTHRSPRNLITCLFYHSGRLYKISSQSVHSLTHKLTILCSPEFQASLFFIIERFRKLTTISKLYSFYGSKCNYDLLCRPYWVFALKVWPFPCQNYLPTLINVCCGEPIITRTFFPGLFSLLNVCTCICL